MTARGWMACGLVASMLAVGLWGCTQDGYDKGEGRYSLMVVELVEAHADADKNVDYVVTDEGERLDLQEATTASWIVTPDSVYRALFYYNRTSPTVASSLALYRVGTATIRRPDEFEGGILQDPVRLESAWVSTSRRYLNLGLYLMTGHTDDDDAQGQTLGIVGDTLMAHADSTRTWHLRLYHDQGDIPQYYSQRLFLSIPLQDVEADTLRLTVNTYDGEVVRTFVY